MQPLLGNGAVNTCPQQRVNKYTTIEELLEVMFSVQSVPGLYSEGHQEKAVSRKSQS
jgi:hypothetical protein